MEESFQLPVLYKGEELLFDARLHIRGYTHKIQVEVNGQEIFFEPDEEKNYRAVFHNPDNEVNKKTDVELLKAIAETIESIIR